MLPLDAVNASLKIQFTPPLFESDVSAGEELSFNIRLKNTDSARNELRAQVLSISMNDEGRMRFSDDPFRAHSCQSWIDLNPKQILLEPDEIKKVMVHIRVPQRIQGGYYAAILFTTVNGYSEQGKTRIGLSVSTGTMVILSARGSLKRDAGIMSFGIDSQAKFTLQFQNKSNVHIKPDVSIVIYDEQDRVIDRINFKEDNFLLPESRRTFYGQWDNAKKKKKHKSYTAECRVTIKGLGKRLIEKRTFHLK